MDLLLKIGVSNALLATALALVVAGLSRFIRRPALVHSLWLLVLLKLVTPPLVWVPIPGLNLDEARDKPTAAPDSTVMAQLHPGTDEGPAADAIAQSTPLLDPPADDARWNQHPDAGSAQPEEALPQATLPAGELTKGASARGPAATSALNPNWSELALWAWAVGSVLWLSLALSRALRFCRLVNQAKLAPAALQKTAAALAQRMGLASCPPVCLVRGRVSPMLWALAGHARLLVPGELWQRLQPEQREALLVHELAHFRRRDHWLRLFELFVTAIYWWHPVAWWALLELRRAEEDCCDAWVVWALPRHARHYATALVETLDFLSETRAPLPVGASGIGHIQDLRRRVTMIMRGTTPRALTWSGVLCVLGLAAFLLPVLPTLAQEDPRDNDNRPGQERQARDKRDADSKDAVDPTDEQRRQAEIERARAALGRAQADIAARAIALKEAQLALQRAQAKLSEPRADDSRAAESKSRAERKALGEALKGKPKKITIIIEDGEGNKKEIHVPLDGDLHNFLQHTIMSDEIKRAYGRSTDRAGTQRPGGGGSPTDQPRREVVPGSPGASPNPGGRPGRAAGAGGQPGALAGPNGLGGNHMQEMELKLDRLTHEIEELRRLIPQQQNKDGKPSEKRNYERNGRERPSERNPGDNPGLAPPSQDNLPPRTSAPSAPVATPPATTSSLPTTVVTPPATTTSVPATVTPPAAASSVPKR